MTKHNVNVSCWGKKPFMTWTAAACATKRKYKRVGRKEDPMRESVYRCKICRQWHVGGGQERD